MVRVIAQSLIPIVAGIALAARHGADSVSFLHVERSSPSDLEAEGELAGLPPGSARYIHFEDLLSLPQESYTLTAYFKTFGPGGRNQ